MAIASAFGGCSTWIAALWTIPGVFHILPRNINGHINLLFLLHRFAQASTGPVVEVVVLPHSELWYKSPRAIGRWVFPRVFLYWGREIYCVCDIQRIVWMEIGPTGECKYLGDVLQTLPVHASIGRFSILDPHKRLREAVCSSCSDR